MRIDLSGQECVDPPEVPLTVQLLVDAVRRADSADSYLFAQVCHVIGIVFGIRHLMPSFISLDSPRDEVAR